MRRPVLYTRRGMLRRCDRYVLREMAGPFFLALAGLVLFILLNIILSLSDLMVDRGIGMTTLLRLVALKMPSLLVIAVPMSALFATFLGLGRMAHDREIVALESIGIPLRRILLPLIFAAAAIGAADFALYNWGVPASEQAYQQALREVIFRQGVPRITANAFFKGADNQFFYIRRYNEEAGTLHDVYIYDTTGQLFPHAESRVTMITAQIGRWTGASWQLESGRVYGFDTEGILGYSGSFDALTIPLDQSVEEVLSRSRTPAEMGIAELVHRIESARASGQRTDEYVVEAHMKAALPLATIVFVLFGGAVSLAFNPRSRAAGIVLGLLLVGLFQGALWWTQTLGRRGAMNPALAAWVPNLVFGAIGLALFLRVDRLAYRDLWSRWRSRFTWFAILLLAVVPTLGQNAPIDITSDEIFLSDDRSEIRASGSVEALVGGTRLAADALDLVRIEEGAWRLEASGSVDLEMGEDVSLQAESLVAFLSESESGAVTRRVEAETFTGHSRFTNSIGQDHDLYFRVAQGTITFDEDGEISLIEANDGEVTTCNCCDATVRGQPYSLSAQRVLLYPDRLLVAFGLIARVGGVSSFWLPFYVRPLEDALESPLFPAIGNSALRGWFVKWNVPFYVSESLYGSVLVDYFSRFSEVGLGALARYRFPQHQGRISFYVLPAKVGDSSAEFELKHSVDFASGWEGTARVEYESTGDKEELSFAGLVEGALEDTELSLAASRETTWTEDEVSVEERIPEVTLKIDAQRFGDLTVRPKLRAGWIREWENDELVQQRLRLSGQTQLIGEAFRLGGFPIAPEATVEAALYGNAADGWDRQESLTLSFSTKREGVSLSWTSTFVHGASPFSFDRAESAHRLRWSLELEGRVGARLDGGLNLEEGLEPIDLRFDWGTTPTWRLDLELDPTTGRLDETVLRGSFEHDPVEVTWKLPYDWSEGAFDDARLDVEVEVEGALLFVASEIDLSERAHLSSEVEFEFTSTTGWGLTFDATFEPEGSRFATMSYGLFRVIADCVRVGVERERDEIWVYASVIAFPEAIVRYAPRASDVEVGG